LPDVHGVVTDFELDGRLHEQEDVARVRITLAPRLSLLGLRKRSRIFQDQTVAYRKCEFNRSAHHLFKVDD